MSALISEPLRKLMEERADQGTRKRNAQNVRRMYVEYSKRAANKRGVQVDADLKSRAEAAAERALAPL